MFPTLRNESEVFSLSVPQTRSKSENQVCKGIKLYHLKGERWSKKIYWTENKT